MEKERSIIDDSSEWYNTFIDVRYRLDKEYEIVCKRYDIDQDNRIYNKLEDVSFDRAIPTQEAFRQLVRWAQ